MRVSVFSATILMALAIGATTTTSSAVADSVVPSPAPAPWADDSSQLQAAIVGAALLEADLAWPGVFAGGALNPDGSITVHYNQTARDSSRFTASVDSSASSLTTLHWEPTARSNEDVGRLAIEVLEQLKQQGFDPVSLEWRAESATWWVLVSDLEGDANATVRIDGQDEAVDIQSGGSFSFDVGFIS